MHKRQTILLIVMTLLAGMCALLAWDNLTSKREAARDSAAARDRAEQWLRDLRGGGKGAPAGEIVRAAKLSDRVIVSPEPISQPLGQGDFVDQQVMLSTQAVDLRQLLELIQELESQGTQARSIRLSVPPGQEDDAKWSAEVVLGRLIYSPGKGASR